MARSTFWCTQWIQLRLLAMKCSPCARTMSATSRCGRFIFSVASEIVARDPGSRSAVGRVDWERSADACATDANRRGCVRGWNDRVKAGWYGGRFRFPANELRSYASDCAEKSVGRCRQLEPPGDRLTRPCSG